MKARARSLRHRMTDAETRLWYLLRDRRPSGAKFRRQVPVGPYILDFYCHAQQLVIEADGGQHAEPAKDIVRDQFLKQQGPRVLRFWNDEILMQQERVLTVILGALRAPSPAADAAASPRGRGNSKNNSSNNAESAA